MMSLADSRSSTQWTGLSLQRRRPFARTSAAVLAHGLPVLGVLFLLAAALWAVGEHERARLALQRAETTRYLAEFSEGPVAQARSRLLHAWQEEAHEGGLAPDPAAWTDAQRRSLLDLIARHQLDDELRVVLGFYRRLALCVRMRSCNRQVAAQRLGAGAWQFLTRYRPYLEEAVPGADLEADFRVISAVQARSGR